MASIGVQRVNVVFSSTNGRETSVSAAEVSELTEEAAEEVLEEAEVELPEEVLPLAPHPARRTTLCNKAPMRIACRILFFILEISFSFDFRSNVRARYLYYKRKVGKKKRTSFCVRCSLPSESELPECVLIAVLRDPWAILRLFRGCVL